MNNEEKILELLAEMKASVDKRFDAVDKRLDAVDKRLDAADKRFDAIEERLDEMQTTLTRVAVTQEGTVLPKLQLLYEGHSAIMDHMDTLTPVSRTEAVEADVSVLKQSHKMLRQDLNGLKKAL